MIFFHKEVNKQWARIILNYTNKKAETLHTASYSASPEGNNTKITKKTGKAKSGVMEEVTTPYAPFKKGELTTEEIASCLQQAGASLAIGENSVLFW